MNPQSPDQPRERVRERERETHTHTKRDKPGKCPQYSTRARNIAQEPTPSRQARRTAAADRTDERPIGSQKPPLRTVLERSD